MPLPLRMLVADGEFAQGRCVERRCGVVWVVAAPIGGLSYEQRKIEAFADFNGDGHVDLAVPHDYVVGIALGRGDGTFHYPQHYETGGSSVTLGVGDLDGDGNVDLLVNNDRDVVSFVRGRCLP